MLRLKFVIFQLARPFWLSNLLSLSLVLLLSTLSHMCLAVFYFCLDVSTRLFGYRDWVTRHLFLLWSLFLKRVLLGARHRGVEGVVWWFDQKDSLVITL